MIIQGEMGIINQNRYSEIKHASFDPGDIVKPSTGVTLWNKEGEVIQTNELDIKNLNLLLDWLESNCNLECIIAEEFRLYQHKALQQSGSTLPAVQIIGMLKRSAYKMQNELIEIRADCKGIAAAWSQTKMPSGHLPNWMASYLVGYYHLHKIGIIPAKVLEV